MMSILIVLGILIFIGGALIFVSQLVRVVRARRRLRRQLRQQLSFAETKLYTSGLIKRDVQ